MSHGKELRSTQQGLNKMVMMACKLLIALSTIALVGTLPLKAEYVQAVDLSTDATQIGKLYGPCWCWYGPVYNVQVTMQDDGLIDFGSVTLVSYYDAHDAGRVQPRYDFQTGTWVYPSYPFNFAVLWRKRHKRYSVRIPSFPRWAP